MYKDLLLIRFKAFPHDLLINLEVGQIFNISANDKYDMISVIISTIKCCKFPTSCAMIWTGEKVWKWLLEVMSWFQKKTTKKSNNSNESYKKQLENKTKTELKSMCKENQLPISGSKKQMIRRLVDFKNKTKPKEKKTQKTEDNDISITISKASRSKPGAKGRVIPTAVLLVDGYIRKHLIKPYKFIYPYDLTKIFCEYLDHIWVCPEKYNHVMKRNGTIIHRPPLKPKANPFGNASRSWQVEEKENVDMIIGSSRGYDSGIFEFALRCIQPAMDAIGIMSEIDECEIEQWISATRGNTYYYVPGSSNGGGGIYSGRDTKNAPPEQFMDEEKKWRHGDKIKMRVDCAFWTCKFFKNGKQIGDTINIEPNCTYHPVLATSKDGSKYELILD